MPGTSGCSLTWLCRFLRMIEGMVAALVQDQGKDVATCVWAGYEQALVQAGVAAAPSRAAFLAALGVPSAAAEQQLRALLAHFSPALRCAVALLVERGVENAY